MYTPLALKERQIRLLELLPNDLARDNVLNCRLVAVDLDNDLPAYEALSYTWKAADNEPDDAVEWQYIILNGFCHNVRPNLSDALDALVRPAGRLLWVDSICIDQENNTEKQQQISVMAEIYQRAVGVVVWLRGSVEIRQKDRLPVDAAPAFQSFLIDFMANERCLIPEEPTGSIRGRRYHEPGMCLIPFVYVDALSYWTDSLYWRRVWVVQELVFAKALTLQLGSISIDWNLLKQAATKLDSHLSSDCCRLQLWKRTNEDDVTYDYLRRFSRAILDIENTRTISRKQSTLETQLRLHSARLATKPRDMIYALLSLVNDWGSGGKPIQPDYNSEKSDRGLICNAIRHIISSYDSLSILCGDFVEVDLQDEYNWYITTLEELRLPSWAGCFAVSSENESEHGGFFTSSRMSHLDLYNASSGAKPSIRGLNNSEILKVQGVSFDRVAMCAKTRLRPGADGTVYYGLNQDILLENNDEEVEVWLNMAQGFVERSGYHATDEPWRQAFARTMHCDVICYDGQYFRTKSGSNLEQIERTRDNSSKGKSESTGGNLEERHLSSSNCSESNGHNSTDQGSNLIRPTLRSDPRRNESQVAQKYGPFALNRVFFITEKGHFGIGPASMRSGDTIVVLFGASVPFVLRPLGLVRPHQYQLLGDCYCHGIMDGEATTDDSTRRTWFELV